MQTKSGKAANFFEKLKTLPDLRLANKKKKAIVFASKLQKV